MLHMVTGERLTNSAAAVPAGLVALAERVVLVGRAESAASAVSVNQVGPAALVSPEAPVA